MIMRLNKIWTYEKCMEVAKKFMHRVDFQKAHRGAYTACQRNNWLELVCSHMQPLGNYSKKCIYVYEFADNHAYVGLAGNLEARHSRRLRDKRDPVYVHIRNTNLTPTLIQLEPYIEVELAMLLEARWETEYKNNNWILLNKVKCGHHIGNPPMKWNKDSCLQEALKYNRVSHFKSNSRGAYSAAKRNGWLDECKIHMIPPKKPNGYWTYDMCLGESKKYSNRIEFRKSLSAYTISCRNGWLNDFYPPENYEE